MESVALNIRGGRNGHLALTTTMEDYLSQTVHIFVSLHNPENYPLTMGTAQRASASNRNLPTKPTTLLTMHRHRQGD